VKLSDMAHLWMGFVHWLGLSETILALVGKYLVCSRNGAMCIYEGCGYSSQCGQNHSLSKFRL